MCLSSLTSLRHLLLLCLLIIFLDPLSTNAATIKTKPSLRHRQSPPPALNTTILDKSGHDITSSFKIMFFHQNLTEALALQEQEQAQNLTSSESKAATNLTNRALSTRQTDLQKPANADLDPAADYSQPRKFIHSIISCSGLPDNPSNNWHFVRSECDRTRSLQSFTFWCRKYQRTPRQGPGPWSAASLPPPEQRPRPAGWGHYGPPQRYRSSCLRTETCLNGPTRDNQGRVEVAWCVAIDKFVELAGDLVGDKEGGGGAGGVGDEQFEEMYGSGKDSGSSYWGSEAGGSSRGGSSSSLASKGGTDVPMDGVDGLDGVAVEVVASTGGDLRTPLTMGGLDVEGVGVGGVMDGVGGGGCENCVDFETQMFRKGVGGVRAEATLLGGLGSVVGGVLWVAALAV